MRSCTLVFVISCLMFSTNTYAQKCECNYQKCIDISNEVELTGITGAKKIIHPTHGEYSSIVLFFEEAICLQGGIYTPGDVPQPQQYTLPNTTHVQLITHGDQSNEIAGINKGNRFQVNGEINYSSSAWHTTPLLLNVTSFKKLQ